MKAAQYLVLPLLFFASFSFAQESETESPLKIDLTSDKKIYRLGEKIVFRVMIKNSSPEPLEVRVRLNSSRPLGTLELVPDSVQGPSTCTFDVDSLTDGTFLSDGLMPAGQTTAHTYSVGPNVTWGASGIYRFRWRAAKIGAVSNTVQIKIASRHHGLTARSSK